MKITCISASNTKSIGDNSTSTKICNLVKSSILKGFNESISVDVVPLMEYDLKTCKLCGDCMNSGTCPYDVDFNKVLEKIIEADAVFVIIPHYSPIPAKLIMVLEKLNEIIYSRWLDQPQYQSPFREKPVGIVGHGGMIEKEGTLRYYHDHLVAPVANTLQSLSFRIIKYNEDFPYGVTFGLRDDSCIKKSENSIFPDIIQDWPMIEHRIQPLIENVMKAIINND
jgi:NAD(P)H-dependent FMN reductase